MSTLNRESVTALLKEAKRDKKLSYSHIAQAIGKHKVWTTAAIHGQHPFQEKEARSLLQILGISENVEKIILILQEPPYRGDLGHQVPTDPTLYRLYEFLQVYGPSLKDLIHEEFGDGIMSAINANVDIKKIQDAEGERVQIIFEGKFLPYKW